MNKIKLKFILVSFALILSAFPLIDSLDKNINEVKTSEKYVFKEVSKNNKIYKQNFNGQSMGNYYIGGNNWILGKFSKVLSEDRIKELSDAINELSGIGKKLGKDTYFVSLAHKTNMLKHLYPEFVTNRDNIDINKKALKSQLNLKNITFIDSDEYFLNNFKQKDLEKFYFKTDHHWNGLGAYEGFKFMVRNMNLGLSDERLENYFNQYKTLIINKKEFIGSYNRKLGFPIKEKDLTSYVYLEDSKYEYFKSDTKKDNEIKEEYIIASFRNKNSWDYGGAYMRGTDCNILKVKNNKALTNKKVLIFRDSYQAPMTWLLSDFFSQVEIVDPRYIENLDMSYEEIIKNSDSDIVLFMYNSFGFEGMIKEMIDKGIR
jgi:hypothetical protein